MNRDYPCIMAAMNDICSWHGLAVFGLELEFKTTGRGNSFSGSAWRGLLGHALAQRVCVREAPRCAGCPQVGQCAYPRLFKPLDAATLAPFWLHGWRRSGKGWRVGVRWIGPTELVHVTEWLEGLAAPDAGRSFGGEPVTLLAAFDTVSGKEAWSPSRGMTAPTQSITLVGGDPPPAACRVRTLAPLVSKHRGDPLFGALATRVQRLVSGSGSGGTLPRPAIPWQAQVVEQRPRAIPLDRRLLSGEELVLELTSIDPFAWELLQAGRELHAGGQAGLGCGHYTIEPVTAAGASRNSHAD